MSSSKTNKVFALSFGKALTSVIGLASGMILARILTVNEFATYRQTILVYSFLVPFMTFGLPDAIYFFLGSEKTRKRGILNDNIFLLCFMGCIFALFLLLGGNILWAKRFSNPQLAETLKIFAPYALFTLPLGTISAVFVVQNKIRQLTFFNVFSRLFIFLFVLGGALLYQKAIGIITCEVLSSFFIFIVIMILVYKVVPNDNGSLQLNGMWTILKYSIPLGLSAMLGTLSVQLDQIIVSSICSPAEYAIYANGTFEIPIIGMITGSIATIILVEMRQNIVDGEITKALQLFRKAALRSSPILIPIMFYLLIQAKPFILILFSSKYLGSVIPFRIYLLMLPARIVFYSSALLAFGLTRLVFFRSALSLIFNSILSIILVHFIGYIGAIISFIIVLYLWDVTYNFKILSSKFECKWHQLLPLAEIAKVAIISAVSSLFIIPFIFIQINNLLSLILSSLIFFPLSFYLMYKYKLIDIDSSLIKQKLMSWKK